MLTSSNERPMPGIESHIELQGGNTMPIYYSFPSRYKMAYLNEVEHFVDILQGICNHLLLVGLEIFMLM
jgi:hypothetical protein